MIRAKVLPGYWQERLNINASKAIFHQWEQLEASGTIENFRLAAGDSEGIREGWFFADSDAFKWLDAASRIYRSHPQPDLEKLLDEFIDLIERAQEPDGYLYTYNQILFPESRWTNLQIEHELYCHGHLIEAGVSHFQATGSTKLLQIAQKAADRIVTDFKGRGPEYTPGHQEIEIALLRLFQETGQDDYQELARQFLEQRGRQRGFGLQIFRQNGQVGRREKLVQAKREAYLAAHPEFTPFQVPAGNEAKKPWNITLRWMINAITGKYFQQHKPVREQTVPVGHSVRFAYQETAAALLARLSGDTSYLYTLERCWDQMVSRRMYVTGGIGSLPALEGFGRDNELDPEFAYAETCAALGSIFWNWEMAQLTSQARYSDLFEWQLYNATAVGMGSSGTNYFYNNPLAARGGVTRQAWYEIPCCPSNISRTWADLDKYLISGNNKEVWVHQYINSEVEIGDPGAFKLKLVTSLPWQGAVRIVIDLPSEKDFSLNLRIPSWGSVQEARINGELCGIPAMDLKAEPTASGFDPRSSRFWPIQRTWKSGDVFELVFEMDIRNRQAHPKVKGHQGKAALTRGPLVYCLESIDNPEVDIFTSRFDPATLTERFDPELFGGTTLISARSVKGKTMTFIPYHLWGNRGPSQMTVWAQTY